MDAFYDLDRELEASEALQRAFRRGLRWTVLKQWWAAQRRLAQANTQHARINAIKDIQQLKTNYGDILAEALPLWDRAHSYKQEVKEIQKTSWMHPYEMDQLWQRIVINQG